MSRPVEGGSAKPVHITASDVSLGGDATAANQTTGNASLTSIDGKTPVLGQAVAGSSSPVVLTAAQIATLTPPAAITGFATETTLAAAKALLDGSTITSQTFTIANAVSLSDAFDLAGKAILRLSMPTAWTAAVITFQTSFDNSTWYDMYDQYGTEISLTVAASRSIAVDVAIFTAMRFVRLRSGTAAAAVNQGAQRLVVATVKAL